MDCNDVKKGQKVRTTKLRSTQGMFIKSRHIECRKQGILGTVSGYVPGHGGDVWFVSHDGTEDVGAYVFDEIEPR